MSFLKISIIFLFFLSISISNKITTFKVEGMMCLSGCVVKVNSVVNSIEGVNNSEVDFKRGFLTVGYDSLKITDDIIIKELSSQTTYKVEKVKKDFNNPLFDWLKIFKKDI
tara:strand:- start:897 stop:1229 length:333 start_codon:yes stop_codon:yes gene_type:complete